MKKPAKPTKEEKAQRKYQRGKIRGWMRPPLSDGSADEGNALDEWEDERWRELCLCEPRPDSTAECTCGCLVQYTRSAWKKHKEKHGLAPPGGWAVWE